MTTKTIPACLEDERRKSKNDQLRMEAEAARIQPLHHGPGLNPNTSVRHTKPEVAKRDEVRGMAMRSQGLLQLAYADQKRYGCNFNWQMDRALKANDPAKTILQPKNNLECGVRILFNQIIVQHKPLLTRSGYWSTLHPDGPSYRVFVKQMTNPPAACGLSPKSTIDKSATTKSVQDDANRGETPK